MFASGYYMQSTYDHMKQVDQENRKKQIRSIGMNDFASGTLAIQTIAAEKTSDVTIINAKNDVTMDKISSELDATLMSKAGLQCLR